MHICDVTRYTDMESEDYPFFQGLVYLLENDVSTLGYELTFSTEVRICPLSISVPSKCRIDSHTFVLTISGLKQTLCF